MTRYVGMSRAILGSGAGVDPYELNATVIVRALVAGEQRMRWMGYARWDGLMPAVFIATVRGSQLRWDDGGALDTAAVRLDVLSDSSGGHALPEWMPWGTDTIAVSIVPGGPPQPGKCPVRPVSALDGDSESAPQASLVGVPAQLRHLVTPRDRYNLELWVYALDEVKDMQILLAVLTGVAQSGWLPDLMYIMDRQIFSERLTTAAIVVQAVHCGPLEVNELDRMSRLARMLDEKDARALVDYAAGAFGMEEEAEGLMALAVGGLDPQVEARLEAGVTASVYAAPVGMGRQPLGLFIGNQAHKAIAARYIAAHPVEDVAVNQISIAATLVKMAYGGIGPATNKDAKAVGELGREPDIVNLTTREVYEIKSAAYFAQGEAKLKLYLDIFARNGVTMRPGSRDAPGTSGIIPGPLGAILFHAPIHGIILYRVELGAFHPRPVTSSQEQENESPSFWRRLERATGYEGVRLALFLVVVGGMFIVTRQPPPVLQGG